MSNTKTHTHATHKKHDEEPEVETPAPTADDPRRALPPEQRSAQSESDRLKKAEKESLETD